MLDCQRMLFEWAAGQHFLTGAVIFAAGLLSSFLGFRMLRFLVILSTAGVGTLAGWLAAGFVGYPADVATLAGAFAGGVLGLACHRAGAVVSAAAACALLAAYLGGQFGLHGPVLWAALGVAGAVGFVLALLNRKTMSIVLTTLQGAALMIVGAVAIATALAPSIGATFRSWATSRSLVIPILLAMLAFMAYSVQASRRQGDIRVGTT